MSYLVKAIRKLKPNAEFSFTDDDYSTIKWDVLDGDAPSQLEIDAAIKTIKADEKAEAKAKATQRQAILDRIGLTADELKTILG
jgi:hypothetical protein